MKLLERFLEYISFDTQSDPSSGRYPSTERQMVFLRHLADQMGDMGLEDVVTDRWGYVTGTIPPSAGCEDAPVIGFLAHVDTSPDISGANVKPRVIYNYDGADIELNAEVTMRVADFPELKGLEGHTLVTTDATTLLGADDKAGVAEIMTAAHYLMNHPEVPHGKIRIGFTPDEEIGRGVDHFDVEKFGARFAYTVDGGAEGELEYENFNAAQVKITIHGRNIHPGYAKGKMVNALELATTLNNSLPRRSRPEFTDGRKGFFHLTHLCGTVDEATMEYIIRDHSRERFERKKDLIAGLLDLMNRQFGPGTVEFTLTDQYYNMKEMVEPHPELIGKARQAMEIAGVKPVVKPIRGGTDGARLSYMGLPCPNLFTGGMNFHGRYEYCSVDVMQKAVEVILNLAQLWAR